MDILYVKSSCEVKVCYLFYLARSSPPAVPLTTLPGTGITQPLADAHRQIAV